MQHRKHRARTLQTHFAVQRFVSKTNEHQRLLHDERMSCVAVHPQKLLKVSADRWWLPREYTAEELGIDGEDEEDEDE